MQITIGKHQPERERERGRVQAEVSIRPLPLELRKIRGGGEEVVGASGVGNTRRAMPT